MTTFSMIVGSPDEGVQIAESRSWNRETHPTFDIDPVDYVAMAELISIITGDPYKTVTAAFNYLTPEQPDVEDWDIDALFATVYELPASYATALTEMEDANLLSIATQWRSIEELQRFNFAPEDLAATLRSIRKLAATARDAGLNVLLYFGT